MRTRYDLVLEYQAYLPKNGLFLSFPDWLVECINNTEARLEKAESLAALYCLMHEAPSQDALYPGIGEEAYALAYELAPDNMKPGLTRPDLLAPVAPPIERADFTATGPSGKMNAVAFRSGTSGVLQDTGADPVHPHFVPVEPKEGGDEWANLNPDDSCEFDHAMLRLQGHSTCPQCGAISL